MKCSGYQQGRGSQWYPDNVKNLMTHFWRNSSVWIDRGKSEHGKRDWKWIRHNWSSMKGSFKKQRRASHEANCKVFVNIFPARCKNIWRILNTIASIWSENTFGHYVLLEAQSFPQALRKLFASRNRWTKLIGHRDILMTRFLTSQNVSLFTANLRFNSVVNTKLPVILSHRQSTTVSLETYPLYKTI